MLWLLYHTPTFMKYYGFILDKQGALIGHQL